MLPPHRAGAVLLPDMEGARGAMSQIRASAARLRERAEKCRQFARESASHGIATELERLAVDYDQDAARLAAVDRDGTQPATS